MTGEISSLESFVWTCLWQSMVLIAVGLAASFLLRRRSSRAHQVLLLSIVAAVIVPVVSVLVRHYELGVFVAEPVAVPLQLESEAAAGDFSPSGPIVQGFEYEPGPVEMASVPATTISQSAPLPWVRIALCGWIVASLALATRLVVTFILGVRLVGRAEPLDCCRLREALRVARAKLGIEHNVEIRHSRSVRSPAVWCWGRNPVLLLPGTAVPSDNGVDWTGVFCHELAHWKRRDHISGLLAEMAVCILPWHLLLWWAKARLMSLSEQACDDWVLAAGRPGTDYAEFLLDLRPGRQMAFVPAVVSSKRGLAGRIRRILKDTCGNPRTGAAWALAVSAITICVALSVAFAQTRPAKPESESAETETNESAAESVDKDALVQRSYRLKNCSPAEMSKIVTPMLSDFGHQSSDEKTNTLLIIDTVENLKRVERIMEHFDVPEAEPCVTDTFKIYYGDPSDITRKVVRLLTGLPSEQIASAAPPSTSLVVGPSGQPVALTPDLTGKRILVTGAVSGEDFRQIAAWIEKLDKPEKIMREYETFQLRYADVDEVAKQLNRAIEQMSATELQQGILIQPLTQARQIMIFGRKDLRDKFKKLIAEFDQPRNKQANVEIFVVRYRDPEELVRVLTRPPSPNPPPGQTRPPFKLIADSRTKSIIATGSSQDIDWVRERIAQLDREPERAALPAGWSLDYDDGLVPGGGRRWPSSMAEDLAQLKIMLKPYDPFKASLKGERYEFRVLSPEGKRMGDIHIRPESDFDMPSSKVVRPGSYMLRYGREWGKPGNNYRMKCEEFRVDLGKPGMYELRFTPKIGTAEITGTLGGCYAINFERIGGLPRIRGFAYQDPRVGTQYKLDGLPAGKYWLSAVTQRQSDNVFVDRSEVTVTAGKKATVDMARPAEGTCSLKGSIRGRTRDGEWFVLIRKRGSGQVRETWAYESRTMDSVYVVRGRNITQETDDRALYHIEGVDPGDYTVTVIDDPRRVGFVIQRQQSRPLTLRAGENTVLDFDLQTVPEHDNDPGVKADIEESTGLIKITGLVKDPQGRPVTGTRVTLFQTKLEYVTDAEGKFTAHLPPSDKMRYFFAVNKQRKLVASGRLAGGRQHLEMKLVPAKMVSGRVVDPSGRPVSGAQVAPLPMTCFHVLTDSEGRFNVGWSPEWAGDIKDFFLMARHQELNLAATVGITESTEVADIKLEPGLTLAGTIEDPDGAPIPNARVGLTLHSQASAPGYGCGTPVRDVLTDDKGHYQLRALPQKQDWIIRANADGYWRNKIETGTINRITDREEAGAIILKKPILSVAGIVADSRGKAVANIPVYFRGEGQPGLDSQTDTQGRFRFDNICAGAVRINAKNKTLFGTIETQGGTKDIRLVVSPRFEPKPADPPHSIS